MWQNNYFHDSYLNAFTFGQHGYPGKKSTRLNGAIPPTAHEVNE